MNIEALVNTSVDDCRLTLTCLLNSDPAACLRTVADLLGVLNARGVADISRRKAASVVGRAALKALTEPDPASRVLPGK